MKSCSAASLLRALALGLILLLLASGLASCSAKDSPRAAEDTWYLHDLSESEKTTLSAVCAGLPAEDEQLTVGELLMLASKVRAAVTAEKIPAKSGEWYQSYVAFCTGAGIITEGQFDDFERTAAKGEAAQVLSAAFEGSDVLSSALPLNAVVSLPDVSEKQPYHDAVLTLVNLGVTEGTDSWGNYRPMDPLTAGDAADLVLRMYSPERRTAQTYDLYSYDDAYTLAHNSGYNAMGNKEGISSGWSLDNRGGAPRTSLYDSYGALADITDTLGTAMIREFNETVTGELVLTTRYTISDDHDGAYIEFRNAAGKSVYRLEIIGDAWQYLGADGSYTKLYDIAKGETVFTFEVHVDIDNTRSKTVINAKESELLPLPVSGADAHIKNFRFGTTEKSTAVISGDDFRIMVNYALYQSRISAKGRGAETLLPFRPVSGIAVTESMFNLNAAQNVDIALLSAGNPVVTLTSDDHSFYANGNMVYENYVKNLWYDFRLELDTDAQTVNVKINGRTVGTVPFAYPSASVDALRIVNNSAASVNFDRVMVYEQKQYDDYVPAPVVPAGEDKYNVGINVCSLWRNGEHFGWSCVSPYDDIEPVLGYYDEGLPETADWEIKYMVEHGIDFQAFCWYAGETSTPLYSKRNAEQLFDGFMNAKYSDYMKYCIIWECANAQAPSNMQQWKDYYVPYFIEHFFRDPRYMTIDNKPLLYIFGVDRLYNSSSKGFGSTAACREAFDYLEEEVKKIGYDGVIFIASHTGSSSTLKAAGFDGAAAYNWGSDGAKLDVNKNRNLSNARDKSVYTIPTVSVGFNNVAWTGEDRYPLITAADFKEACLWMRDEYEPSHAEDGTWQENLYHLSTWNEYGEGTYIMPCEGHVGFGYLDALREVFTDEKADPSLNQIPTAEQRARINRLYPQDKHLMRKQGWLTEEEIPINYDECTSVLSLNPGTHPGTVNHANCDNWVKNADGLSGVTTTNDCYLSFGNGNSLDLDKAKIVKITASIPKGETMRFFFTTQADQAWNESKAISPAAAASDELTDYYLDLSENKNWTGTMLWYRIDPTSSTGTEFRITNIEFLTLPASAEKKTPTLTVNGNAVELRLPSVVSSNGEYLLPFDPAVGTDFLLNTYYEWDKAAGVFTLYADQHRLVYTVGSKKVNVDGTSVDLSAEFALLDGLPLLPFKQFCELVGYTFTMGDNGPVITTTERELKASYYDALENRVPYSWEFNVNGDAEGWTSYNMSLLSCGGFLACETVSDSVSPDPILNITVPAFSAEEYHTLKMRVRYDSDVSGQALTLYFATTAESGLSESKTIKMSLSGKSSDGEWEEYEADCLDNPLWTGKITQIRFDPFNANGHMDIDYLRILKDE